MYKLFTERSGRQNRTIRLLDEQKFIIQHAQQRFCWYITWMSCMTVQLYCVSHLIPQPLGSRRKSKYSSEQKRKNEGIHTKFSIIYTSKWIGGRGLLFFVPWGWPLPVEYTVQYSGGACNTACDRSRLSYLCSTLTRKGIRAMTPHHHPQSSMPVRGVWETREGVERTPLPPSAHGSSARSPTAGGRPLPEEHGTKHRRNYNKNQHIPIDEITESEPNYTVAKTEPNGNGIRTESALTLQAVATNVVEFG